MFVKLHLHGVFKEKMPKGHKRPHTIYAQSVREVVAYLSQFDEIRELLKFSQYELRVGKSIKSSRSLTAEEAVKMEFGPGSSLHLAPHVSGHAITGAMLITAAISVAVNIGLMLLNALFFPPPSTGKDDRKSVLYQGGMVTQKENVPLGYIAGLDVLCGSNLIEGIVHYTSTGGLSTKMGLSAFIQSAKSQNTTLTNSLPTITPGYQDVKDDLNGAKGGGKTIKNTVFTDAVLRGLLALGDGPIGGIVGDTIQEKERNIYINEIPLRDHGSNQYNFQGVGWSERFGEEGQTPDPITPFIGTNQDGNVQLEYGVNKAVEHLVTDDRVNRVVVRVMVNQLLYTTKKGNQQTTSVTLGLDVKRVSDGDWTVVTNSFSYTGKSTDPIVLEHEVFAPPRKENGETWMFRVYRLTPDSTDDKLQNDTSYNGCVEFQDVELSYDGTGYTHNGVTYPASNVPVATLGFGVDLSQFDQGGNMPEVAVRCAGHKVRVPSNYNPITRTYAGTWDGSWKTAATQNPVWHWLHIATAPVQGLGLPEDFFNKFFLYPIAQYCDGDVNGRPRYTLNKQFSDDQDGWPLLVELAASFRAFPYFNGTEIILVQDAPTDHIDHYVNNAMIDGGWFDFQGTDIGEQFNEILVEWDDPDDYFRKKTVRYRDTDAIARNKAAGLSNGGIIRQTYYKTGCTNQQEAYDFARLLVYVSQNENEVVAFKTLVEAAAYAPGQLIAVDDVHTSGKTSAGRLAAVNGSTVTLGHKLINGIPFLGWS
ncbi:MAG: hypothetical protein BGP16_00860 [Sphingobium sp. 66-54]|nr:MAG: hypothetical protein BGP16_00860 [Sphingobium sp. 66-54]